MNSKFIASVFMIVAMGCENRNQEVTDDPSSPDVNRIDQNHTVNTVLFHQTAAEYQALCFQTYNLAKIQLEKRLQQHAFPYDLPPAIVMDLDETVVDNSFFNAQLILDSTNYTRERWMEWSNLMSAGEVPGAIEFIKYAQGLGVEVMFVSNRRIEELHNTIENLKSLGLENVDTNQVLLRVDEASKKNRRDQVSENYEVLMLFGDNLADFSEVFDKQSLAIRNNFVDSLRTEFGSRFIILPNILYGEWEGALFEYNRSFSQSQKDSVRKSHLVGY